MTTKFLIKRGPAAIIRWRDNQSPPSPGEGSGGL
jgi:hypothetical protein